ncbi:MAG: hypothetical protein ACREID_09950 [Planctomycetota bacterium]
MDAPPAGSLVVPSPSYRAAMNTGEGAALLLALRRGSGHLYYVATGRAFWVPMRDVRAIPPEAVRPECLELLLSSLLLSVEAMECEVEEVGGRSMRLTVEVPEISREGLHALERRLGAMLAGYFLEPGGRHAMTLRLELVSLPEAQGAGR